MKKNCNLCAPPPKKSILSNKATQTLAKKHIVDDDIG